MWERCCNVLMLLDIILIVRYVFILIVVYVFILLSMYF